MDLSRANLTFKNHQELQETNEAGFVLYVLQLQTNAFCLNAKIFILLRDFSKNILWLSCLRSNKTDHCLHTFVQELQNTSKTGFVLNVLQLQTYYLFI